MLKLGGSVITRKEAPMTPDHGNIERLVEEITSANPRRLILVHGGGSFGHPVAKRYKIADGFFEEGQILGFSKTHHAMATLNGIVIEALMSKSLPALSIAPSSFLITDGGRMVETGLEVIRRAVEEGIIPVLYGDAVLDRSMGFSILSGDQLAARLAIELHADYLIYGVDVDGVYTSNPKLDSNAKLIERLTLEEMKGHFKFGRSVTTDVTGGMRGKLSEAVKAVEAGIPVRIVNASKPGVILKALRGEESTGTLLVG